MDIGFVGLRDDRVARRLAAAGVRVFGCDPAGGVDALSTIVVPLHDAVAVAKALTAPRVAWLDLPTGFATELAIQDVWPEFSSGDVIVDAGGGTAADGVRRAASLASARMHFVDCWVRDDLTLVLGGVADAIRVIAPYVELIGAWTHAGPPGSGYHAALKGRQEGLR